MMLLYVFIFLNLALSVWCACPQNTLEWQSNCFEFRKTDEKFANAELACVQAGGHLASIHDSFTNALLEQHGCDAFHCATQSACWVGAMGTTSWNWTDQSGFDWSDWKDGEYPKPSSNPRCLALTLRDGTWIDEDCSKAMPFICNYPQPSPSTTPPPTTQAPKDCGFGWAYYPPAHACYGGVFASETMDWQTAESTCQNFGGHLPSIHSYEELQFLGTYVNALWNGFWLGLITQNGGKSWSWSDGTPLDYTSWLPGALTNVKTKACGYVLPNSQVIGFYDGSCNQLQKYICKKYL